MAEQHGPRRKNPWRRRQYWMLAMLLLALGLPSFFIVSTSAKRDTALARLTESAQLERSIHGVERRNEAAKQRYPTVSTPKPAVIPASSTGGERHDDLGNTAIDDIARILHSEKALGSLGEWNSLSPQEKAQLAQWLIDHQEVIARLRDLAAAGVPWYQLDLSQGFEVLLPHLAPLRGFARLLAAQSMFDLEHGDTSSAYENLRAIYQLGGILTEEPILISQLVRCAIGDVAFEQYQHFPPGSLSASQQLELMQFMDSMDYQQSFSNAMYGEASMGLWAFQQVRQGAGNLDTLVGGDDFVMGLYGSVLARPWFNLDEGEYANTMQEVATLSQIPYYQALPQIEAFDARMENLPVTRVMTRVLAPALARALVAPAEATARVELAQGAMRVEQYHAAHGTYPDTLASAGVSDVDPFTGEPYLYSHTDAGYEIYSVGRDLEDDGGENEPREGDLVWRGGAR